MAGHIIGGIGNNSEQHARQILAGVAAEYPHLLFQVQSEAAAERNGDELTLRFVWHLAQCGYFVGRQKNPSGRISNDKIAIILNDQPGIWRAVDFLTLANPDTNTPAIPRWIEVPLPSLVNSDGLADGVAYTPEQPPVPQPPQPQPPSDYPGDELGWAIGRPLFEDYDKAHQPPNAGMGVWFWRTAWDMARNGMTADAAVAKHRKEWRTALGLPPLP